MDAATGAVRANFTNPDPAGSEWTFLTIQVSDGLDTSLVRVTVRWAPAGEITPRFTPTRTNSDSIDGSVFDSGVLFDAPMELWELSGLLVQPFVSGSELTQQLRR